MLFFTTQINLKRFFFCFHFSSYDLDKFILPRVKRVNDSVYQADRDLIELFFRVATFCKLEPVFKN